MDLPYRTAAARIAPLEVEAWDPTLRETLLGNRPAEMGDAAAPVFNHPRLATAFSSWGGQILFRSSLSARDRELAILRTGWLARAPYEWHHHVAIGRDQAGMTDADIELARAGPVAGSSAPDDVLLRAVDELVADQCITDSTWSALATRFDQTQLMDLVFTVGQYAMVSMALNSFGVRLEPEYGG